MHNTAMAGQRNHRAGVAPAKRAETGPREDKPDRVKLYLASRSPRRRELLAGLGYRFEVVDAGIDESRVDGETPARYVERMAREKALAGLDAVGSAGAAVASGVAGAAGRGASLVVVVGADTIVVVDDEVLGKPRDDAEVLQHLERLSGRDHQVLSAVALASGGEPRGRFADVRLSRNRVWFRPLSAGERDAYRATGEPADKAGSYAIQGLAAAFVTRLEGSWSAVVGLPLHETAALLDRAGVPPFLPPPTNAAPRGSSASAEDG